MKMTNRKQFFAITMACLLALPLLLVLAVSPAAAESAPQIFYLTPTPDELGRVIYIVQAGDTCTSISLKNNISIEDLRLLNDITGENCTVYEGNDLLLDIVVQPTGLPITPTPTSLFPTPTPFAGFATICIRLFDDVNGDSQRAANEVLLPGGAVSITDPLKKSSWSGTTVYNEELCFEGLPAGEYNISIGIPSGYNATIDSNQKVNVGPGGTALVNFGAQSSGAEVVTELAPEASQGGKSPLLAIVGAIMLLAGGGLGIYMTIMSKRKDPF